MFESISDEAVERLPVVLYKTVLVNGNKMPALLRFYLPTWRGYDEVFWQALCDYAILTLHRVKDLEYNAESGKMKIEYFVRASELVGRIRRPSKSGKLYKSSLSWWKMKRSRPILRTSGQWRREGG